MYVTLLTLILSGPALANDDDEAACVGLSLGDACLRHNGDAGTCQPDDDEPWVLTCEDDHAAGDDDTGFDDDGLGDDDAGFDDDGLGDDDTGFDDDGLGDDDTGFDDDGLGDDDTGFDDRGNDTDGDSPSGEDTSAPPAPIATACSTLGTTPSVLLSLTMLLGLRRRR